MKALVVANWKMNPATWREAKKLFAATKKASDSARHVSLVVCPPSIYLRSLRAEYKSRKILFGVQHAHEEEGGAQTGEMSIAQAADAGASYVLIGHAERRARGETNEDTGRKVRSALQWDLTPILCVGEKERRDGGEYLSVVRDQLRAALFDVPAQQMKRIIVVYEPLWTIGKETSMDPRQMHEMAIFIRKSIVDWKGDVGMNVRILYGGSVDETGAGAMLRDGDVHGLLVGRASERPERIAALLAAIESTP